MSDDVDVDNLEDDINSAPDFFDHEPTKKEKIEMRKAVKKPSEWLKLLCRDWAIENEVLVETTDAKFLEYKPYLKGFLSSQLLCRLSIPAIKDGQAWSSSQSMDFWEILGIVDSFDRAYIVAQVERFCSLYAIRAITLDEPADHLFTADVSDIAAAAAAGLSVSPGGAMGNIPHYIDPAAAAAAAALTLPGTTDTVRVSKRKHNEPRGKTIYRDDSSDASPRGGSRKETRRVTQEKKDQKHKDREVMAAKKATDRAVREASREERRRRKVERREEREKFAQEQKEAALKRAAELVASNRVPIEITRGAAAAKAAQAVIQANSPLVPQQQQPPPTSKKRSAVVVSTASDLHQIVTHSKNLFSKYSAIAKEHNQKVSWITVARELGIHVKVREKYARMHSRAVQRGFDWVKNGHWKIKDHPEIFHEPTQAEQKAKMPPPPPDESQTVLVEGHNLVEGHKEISDDAVAAAAAVVDASVNPPMEDHDVTQHVKCEDDHKVDSRGAVAATLVADPTAGSYQHDDDQGGGIGVALV